MDDTQRTKKQQMQHAIYIGALCAAAYLVVYFARNILGTVTPQMLESGYTEEYIGMVSSMYFVFYAVGQLANGILGDKVKARYMLTIGLLMAGAANVLFYRMSADYPMAAMVIYGMMGYFLSMIYGPMTKLVAENTEPVYTTRCSLAYTFAAYLGSPLAGIAAMLLAWQTVFVTGSMVLGGMALAFFAICTLFERKQIVQYHQYDGAKEQGGGVKALLEHQIVKFTLISVLTGVIRTTVVFWMPTYFVQYLGFSAEQAAAIFTGASVAICLTTFITVYIYEKLDNNMDLTILLMFIVSTVFFVLVYLVQAPAWNIVLLIVAIMASNGAATMLWSRYCPSLRDTGMVSSATGFLDFMSYMAAAVSSVAFANTVSTIGWGSLILSWAALMAFGVIVSLPVKNKKRK